MGEKRSNKKLKPEFVYDQPHPMMTQKKKYLASVIGIHDGSPLEATGTLKKKQLSESDTVIALKPDIEGNTIPYMVSEDTCAYYQDHLNNRKKELIKKLEKEGR